MTKLNYKLKYPDCGLEEDIDLLGDDEAAQARLLCFSMLVVVTVLQRFYERPDAITTEKRGNTYYIDCPNSPDTDRLRFELWNGDLEKIGDYPAVKVRDDDARIDADLRILLRAMRGAARKYGAAA